jgi:hypothetical protein
VPWSPLFEDPIILPRGRKLLTLKDAADYITKLPRKESDLPERQTAAEKSKDQLSRDFWARSIFDFCNNTVKSVIPNNCPAFTGGAFYCAEFAGTFATVCPCFNDVP